jgi:predicted PurR-regulated permease PerM
MTKLHSSRAVSSIRAVPILIAVVAALYFAREILIPLAFAVTLAMILAPAVGLLARLRVGRAFAALAMVAVTVFAAGAISFVIFNQMVEVLNEFPSYRDNIHSKIQAMRAPTTGALGRATENVKELGKELSTAPPPPKNTGIRRNAPPEPTRPLAVQIVAGPASEFEYLRDLSKPFLAPLGVLGIVLIFTVFLLIEQDDLRNRLFRLAGLNRLNLMTQALDDATRRVSRYLMLQFLVNACFGVLLGIGLYFIGVPYAALWGTVAAIFRIVPYIGSAAAGLLPLLLSLAVFDGWVPPLLVFLMFVVLELVTANLIEPWLYGTHTGISSLALLVTTVFWTTLWGPAGLVLSTPLTVCLVVLGRHVPQFSFLHVLLGDEPDLAFEAQLCQRLLAMDESGARLVMDQYLDKYPVSELYDSVMIPALTMVERDRHQGALEPEREEFIFLTIREMLSDFAERLRNSEVPGDSAQTPVTVGRMLCIPAAHESDEIAAAMLAQLLEPMGCATIVLPLDTNNMQLLDLLVPEENDTFLVSALPPVALAGARTLSSHLRRRFPKTKVVVGLWGFSGNATRALQRFQPLPPDKVVTSLASAVDWIGSEEARGVGAEESAETIASN